MLVRVHRAQISIPKGAEEQARDFYPRVLGLRAIEKPAALRFQATNDSNSAIRSATGSNFWSAFHREHAD